MATATLLPRPNPTLYSGRKHFPFKPSLPVSVDMSHKPDLRFSQSSATSATSSSSSSWEREEELWAREEPRPNPTLYSGRKHFPFKPSLPVSVDMSHKPNLSFSQSSATSATSSSSSSWEREVELWALEERRWVREEKRWVREEQRWHREELRWSSEREALLREIATLRLRVEALEGERSPIAASVKALLMTEKERHLLAEAETFPVEKGEVNETVCEETRLPEEKGRETLNEINLRKTLRMGSEGEDVRDMQEALLRLGFFSGEDDMEYSSFSSGTDRAVKTWQASLGVAENGIMTAELLEKLFVEQYLGDSSLKGSSDQIGNSAPVERNVDDTNGAAVASVSKLEEIKETVIKEADDAEINVSQPRVFLLGENRWEEPSRLRLDKPTEPSKVASRTQCLACHGEGRVMCTECDGSGEPNVEPQFLEWIGEAADCPYCEGRGYSICDVCEGKKLPLMSD